MPKVIVAQYGINFGKLPEAILHIHHGHFQSWKWDDKVMDCQNETVKDLDQKGLVSQMAMVILGVFLLFLF